MIDCVSMVVTMRNQHGLASKAGIVLGYGQYHSAVARGFELEVLICGVFVNPIR